MQEELSNNQLTICGNLSSFWQLYSSILFLVFPSCYNETFIEEYCGANHCQTDLNATRRLYSTEECPVSELQSGKAPPELLYTLMGIYCGIALFGAGVVALCVDPIQIR